MIRRFGAIVALLIAIALPQAHGAHAQTPAQRMLDAARAHIDGLMWDSAFALLQTALDPRTAATHAERVRAFTLLGLTELSRDNRTGARQAFEQALRLDRELTIDSLAALHTDVTVAFREARSELGIVPLGTAAPLTVQLHAPSDTVVVTKDGGLRFDVEPSAPALVAVNVVPVGDSSITWSEERYAPGIQERIWSLQNRDGVPVPSGRYRLRVTATGSIGQVAPGVERILVLTREQPDTSALPPPPPDSVFRPERIAVSPGSPRNLLVGALFGLAAGGLSRFADGSQGRDGVIVGGFIMVTGVIGFLSSHRAKPSRENMQYNRALRDQRAQERALAIARAIEHARVRVRMEQVSQ